LVKNPAASSWRYPGVLAEEILGPSSGCPLKADRELKPAIAGDVDALGARMYIRGGKVKGTWGFVVGQELLGRGKMNW